MDPDRKKTSSTESDFRRDGIAGTLGSRLPEQDMIAFSDVFLEVGQHV